MSYLTLQKRERSIFIMVKIFKYNFKIEKYDKKKIYPLYKGRDWFSGKFKHDEMHWRRYYRVL